MCTNYAVRSLIEEIRESSLKDPSAAILIASSEETAAVISALQLEHASLHGAPRHSSTVLHVLGLPRARDLGALLATTSLGREALTPIVLGLVVTTMVASIVLDEIALPMPAALASVPLSTLSTCAGMIFALYDIRSSVCSLFSHLLMMLDIIIYATRLWRVVST